MKTCTKIVENRILGNTIFLEFLNRLIFFGSSAIFVAKLFWRFFCSLEFFRFKYENINSCHIFVISIKFFQRQRLASHYLVDRSFDWCKYNRILIDFLSWMKWEHCCYWLQNNCDLNASNKNSFCKKKSNKIAMDPIKRFALSFFSLLHQCGR